MHEEGTYIVMEINKNGMGKLIASKVITPSSPKYKTYLTFFERLKL